MASFVLLSLVICLIPILIAITWKLLEDGSSSVIKCEGGQFILPGMVQCHPLLDCQQISQQIVTREIIGQGAVKMVKQGEWQGHSVAVNILINPEHRDDFLQGLHNLRLLQSKVRITQLVGVCEPQDIFLTQFYPLGSADQLEQVLNRDHFHALNTVSTTFALCVDYVNILHSLHSGVDGARVMCDSNDVNKTLSQFLLAEDLSLVLNDVDALPLVNKSQGQLVKCGHRELFGEFVAPEQLWPFEDRDFTDSEMPGYDEKVDIWKVPDVCKALLGHADGSAKMRMLQLRLLSYHLQCKRIDPSERPAASELLEAYQKIRDKLSL
ncbi:hypothetical protein ACOMHN_035802 [Nucella lapillus]